MKKIISLVLCFALVISLCCSCGKRKEDAATIPEDAVKIESAVAAPGSSGGVSVTDTIHGTASGDDKDTVIYTEESGTNALITGDDAAEKPDEAPAEGSYLADVAESKVTLVTDASYDIYKDMSAGGSSESGSGMTEERETGFEGATVVVTEDALGDWISSETGIEAIGTEVEPVFDFSDLTDIPWIEEPEGGEEIGEITDPVIDIPIISDDPAIDEPIIDPIEPVITPEPYIPQITAGMLTAAEWNDNKNFDFLQNLIRNGQQDNYAEYFRAWKLTPFNRISVLVAESDGVTPIKQAKVELLDAAGAVIWTSVTDHNGMAYLFYNLHVDNQIPAGISVSELGIQHDLEASELNGENTLVLTSESTKSASKALDLMFVVDTTGSMGDEIYYLQAELQDIIKRVTGNADGVRLSVNFYRDHGDDYIVKSSPFSTDINSQIALLNTQYALGGGDYEEAVEEALEDAVNNHLWSEDSVKLCFMVLDAPPHNTSSICESLNSTLTDAAAKGIRIIPVASSGVDRSTEFLLRTMSMITGGTYTFITDDSGIGGSHLEPIVGDYDVVNLNDLLVSIINEYLK